MPTTAIIPTEISEQNGYAFAAIVNGRVIAVRPLNVGEAFELTSIDADAEVAALSEDPVVQEARAADERAWAAYEESGYDDDAVDYNAFAMTIRFGMVSGGEFTHTFSKNEAKRAGLPANWG